MPLDAAIPLGPFLVDRAGHLHLREPHLRPRIAFTWRGRPIVGRLQDGRLEIEAMLGRIPSTACGSPERRAALFTLLRRLPPDLPPGWRARLLPDHRLVLDTADRMPMPFRVSALVGAITNAVLVVAPYLDLFEECGLAAGGTDSTCPG